MPFVRSAALLLWKDVVVELRAKELVYATVFFAAIVLLVFAFAFLGGPLPTVDVSAGVLWVALVLTGTLGIGRAFEREREGDTLRALMLSPLPRAAIYVSKLAAIALLMAIVETVVVLLMILLFHLSVAGEAPRLVAFLALGTLGFAAVAALFGASLGRARSRDVLLPLLTYPVVVPVLIAGTRGTVALLTGDGAVASYWLKFLLVFDAIFVTIAVRIFEPLLRGDS
ncbi:MAG TPA: heme exporter protein CcmB [Polyangia bacterium]|nr:heme exporter protein CcmB [Polyangia bacterium]